MKISPTSIGNNYSKNTKLTDSSPYESIIVPKAVNAGQQLNAMSQNATNQMINVNNGTARGVESIDTDDTARVNISKQWIDMILIGKIVLIT